MFFVRPNLTAEEIEKRKDDYTLFKYYCDNFDKEDVKFKADLRKDNNPSAIVTRHNGRLWYKDFGNPMQSKAYNIYQFIMHKYNLKFDQCLDKINSDFNLGLGFKSTTQIAPVVNDVVMKSNCTYEKKDTVLTEIKVRKIELTRRHVQFWSQYDIPNKDVVEALKRYKIFPISHFWIDNEKQNKMYVVNDIGFDYDYHWHQGIFLRKIYLPKKTGSEFYTNSNKLITQGYEQLPDKGELVFITSSMKDVVILDHNGFNAIAPSNENAFLQPHIFDDIKNRFKNIVLFYDNDFTKEQNWGKMFAEKYSQLHNIPYIMLPDNTEKDPSDYAKTFGGKELKTVIKQQLHNVGIY